MKKLYIVEMAAVCALLAGLLTGVWAQKTQADVASELVRLHVLAKDDSEYEQAVKLEVRDEVLAYLQPVLAGADSQAEAMELLDSHMEGIRNAAKTAAGNRPVAVTLTEEYYPTREYEGFALPAGEYTSLRVILADGEGRNWWCVVYPPLCTDLALDRVSEDTEKLITRAGDYEVRFKVVELWGEVKEWIMDNDGEDEINISFSKLT